MSKYFCQSNDENIKVIVGYEPSDKAFFAKIINTKEQTALNLNNIKSVDELKNKIKIYTSITLCVEQNLKEDQHDFILNSSPLQDAVKKFLQQRKQAR